MTSWAGFWIFLAVYVGVEAWLYNKGHETLFFTHKTPTEIQLRDQARRGTGP